MTSAAHGKQKPEDRASVKERLTKSRAPVETEVATQVDPTIRCSNGLGDKVTAPLRANCDKVAG